MAKNTENISPQEDTKVSSDEEFLLWLLGDKPEADRAKEALREALYVNLVNHMVNGLTRTDATKHIE